MYRFAFLVGLLCLNAQIAFSDINRFVGSFGGSAEIIASDGTSKLRDMSVTIGKTDEGFSVKWTTITHKTRGRVKEETYELNFFPSERNNVFKAAMKRNLFGHDVQLDPMRGEPFVWARILDDTLTVYSLFVNDAGGYELQQFDRTLVSGGLQLIFSRVSNGKELRAIEVFLEKTD